jgi:hypothetical protein
MSELDFELFGVDVALERALLQALASIEGTPQSFDVDEAVRDLSPRPPPSCDARAPDRVRA